ncbi:MAG: hypothetical protein JW727_02775 [Candidatus Aenigmarchaeota archaeon]|nr:hypothetical protein [Candidatus Aenigmarchaeota archaeon]
MEKDIVIFKRKEYSMEYALYVGNTECFSRVAGKYILKLNESKKINRYLQKLDQTGKVLFSRIYFGSEFCERMIPDIAEIKKAVGFCNKNALSMSLLTPYVTDRALDKLKEIFELWQQIKPKNAEIIFNDWGVFHYLRQKYDFKLSIGRLLTKQKKDPSLIEAILDEKFFNLDTYSTAILKQSGIDASETLKNFILCNKISRIELDNVYQGIESDFNIKKSLYYPFVPVATTRFCKSPAYYFKKPFVKGKNPCNRECLTSLYSYSINNVKLFLKGNTQFYCNNKLPENISIFDRIVFEPPELLFEITTQDLQSRTNFQL